MAGGVIVQGKVPLMDQVLICIALVWLHSLRWSCGCLYAYGWRTLQFTLRPYLAEIPHTISCLCTLPHTQIVIPILGTVTSTSLLSPDSSFPKKDRIPANLWTWQSKHSYQLRAAGVPDLKETLSQIKSETFKQPVYSTECHNRLTDMQECT